MGPKRRYPTFAIRCLRAIRCLWQDKAHHHHHPLCAAPELDAAAGSVIAMSDVPTGTTNPQPATEPTQTTVRTLPTSVESMNRVSPKLAWPKMVGNFMSMVLLCGILYLCWLRWDGLVFLIPLCVFGVFFIWQFFLIPFQVRNMGWLETEDELILSTGKWFHTITVIPYGRIQFVDVESGPVGRALGLKELKVHTASNSSNSDLPGLLAADADALRDRLAVKARERMSGL